MPLFALKVPMDPSADRIIQTLLDAEFKVKSFTSIDGQLILTLHLDPEFLEKYAEKLEYSQKLIDKNVRTKFIRSLSHKFQQFTTKDV